MMIPLILALVLQLFRGGILVPATVLTVVEPAPPLNSVAGSVVLVNATVNREGKVQNVAVLQGMAPFIDPTTQAIRQWQFHPAQIGAEAAEGRVGVLAIYRPAAFGAFAVGGPSLGFREDTPGDSTHPALPVSITDPGYPVTSTSMGVVVLELSIDKNGLVSGIRTVRDVPSLTETARDAIQAWKFSAAMESNQAVDGRLIVATSFLRPVIAIP